MQSVQIDFEVNTFFSMMLIASIFLFVWLADVEPVRREEGKVNDNHVPPNMNNDNPIYWYKILQFWLFELNLFFSFQSFLDF